MFSKGFCLGKRNTYLFSLLCDGGPNLSNLYLFLLEDDVIILSLMCLFAELVLIEVITIGL